MKKLVLVLLIVSTAVFAQKPNKGGQDPNHEKIKALKIAHITNQLDLTSAEAEKFWPIYNEFNKNLKALREKEKNEIESKLQNGGIDALTDNEANAIIDQILEMKTQEIRYRKNLNRDLQGVITPQKIIKLHRAEKSFKRVLLDRLKQRRTDIEQRRTNLEQRRTNLYLLREQQKNDLEKKRKAQKDKLKKLKQEQGNK